MNPDPPRAPAVKLPARYAVQRVIGRGGASTVFLAVDRRLERPVAVKVFAADGSTSVALEDQRREARLLAGLNHPNLVSVFDVATDGSRGQQPQAFLVMEYVDGPNLTEWLKTDRATPRQVAQLGAALTGALEYVHRNGVLHCDIKPSNVLLRVHPDGHLTAKLADFGIAAVLEGEVPQGEFTVGTAAYLSPEQADGRALAAPSDVYALGLVLLEAATGDVAFPGDPVESAVARLTREPEVPAHLPAGLAEPLRGMTRRDVRTRWRLEQAEEAFRAYLDDTRAAHSRRSAVAATSDESGLLLLEAELPLPALEHALDLALHMAGSPRGAIISLESGRRLVRAIRGITVDALDREGAVGDVEDERWMRTTITSATGAPLGVIVTDGAPGPTGAGRSQLHHLAGLVAEILDLRAATRRALLAH